MSITIQIPERMKKFDPTIQLTYFADELSKLLYGKSFADIVGHAQTIKVKSLTKDGKRMPITMSIPQKAWDESDGGHMKGAGWYARKQSTRVSITHMVKHARSKGITVALKFV